MNKHWSLLIFSTLISFKTLAWSPCWTFCDGLCTAPAVTQQGVAMGSSVNSILAQEQALLQELGSTSIEIATAAASMSTTLTKNTTSFLSGLSASTNRIELAILSQIKTREAVTDGTIAAHTQVLKETAIAKTITETEKAFGAMSSPISGDIGAGESCLVRTSGVQKDQILERLNFNFEEYSKSQKTSDSGISVAVANTKPESSFVISPLVMSHTFSDEQKGNMEEFIMMISNTNPVEPVINDEGSNATIVLLEKIDITREKMVFSILSQLALSNTGTIAANAPKAYSDRSTNYTKVGQIENLTASVNGRISSEGWYLEAKTMSRAGLLREAIYLKAEENSILQNLLKIKEWKNNLLALKAISKVHASQPM